MAEFLTTTGTSHNIEDIIINAKESLFLFSPYLQISKTFFERLKDASNRNVEIVIVYGKNELKKEQETLLNQLDNLTLYFSENLHAKCYFNEDKMVITSMNMYEFSEKNNREMGILIQKSVDTKIFEEARNETISIVNNAIKETKKQTKVKKRANFKSKKGYCIRCKRDIDYSPEKPYCLDCFSSWVFFENSFFIEKHCHSCGSKEESMMDKPECYNCYIENR